MQLKVEREEALVKIAQDEAARKVKKPIKVSTEPITFKSGVGKYINPAMQ